MSRPGGPDPSGDVKIRWVEPNFEHCRGANKVRDEERQKPLPKHPEVFAIDLHATTVQSALEWAEHFRAGLDTGDPAACLIVYGREIKPEEQVQFALAGIHVRTSSERTSNCRGRQTGCSSTSCGRLLRPVWCLHRARAQPVPRPRRVTGISTRLSRAMFPSRS